MVSNTSDDFPDPDTPVNTVTFCLGMFSEISLRLFSRAPRTSMNWRSVMVASLQNEPLTRAATALSERPGQKRGGAVTAGRPSIQDKILVVQHSGSAVFRR